MLSQDNSPTAVRRSHAPARAILGSIQAASLAILGLLMTATPLHWQAPVLDQTEKDPVITASVTTKTPQTARAHIGKNIGKNTVPDFQPLTPHYKNTIATVRGAGLGQSRNSDTERASSRKRRAIRQPGNNIVINQLPFTHTIPVSSGGMPEFYKAVLEPQGKMTEIGLIQRKARANFGYDQQDIFTGEVPDGAYVLHCQRLNTSTIRAMCWRELQVSDDQWVQYRFPRSQLKDWWKIEQKVRASIG